MTRKYANDSIGFHVIGELKKQQIDLMKFAEISKRFTFPLLKKLMLKK